MPGVCVCVCGVCGVCDHPLSGQVLICAGNNQVLCPGKIIMAAKQRDSPIDRDV